MAVAVCVSSYANSRPCDLGDSVTSAPLTRGEPWLYCYSKGKPSLQWAKESAMTTKFEDVYLGVSPGEYGIRIVYSRNYADKRPSSLVVRDGRDTLVVVKEVPLTSGKSMITIALDAYDEMSSNRRLIAKMHAETV